MTTTQGRVPRALWLTAMAAAVAGTAALMAAIGSRGPWSLIAAAAAVVSAEPVSPAPNSARAPIAVAPPSAATPAPAVAATTFASTRCRRATTCGSAADSPASTNLLTPATASAARYSGGPATPPNTITATTTVSTARNRFATSRTAMTGG